MESWFRFHEILFDDHRLMLVQDTYPVLKTTAAGVWLDVYGDKRFVLNAARKRYACPTIEEALASYHARKARQIRILRQQLVRAEVAASLKGVGEVLLKKEGEDTMPTRKSSIDEQAEALIVELRKWSDKHLNHRANERVQMLVDQLVDEMLDKQRRAKE